LILGAAPSSAEAATPNLDPQRPDLATSVRPKLDQITAEIMRQLKVTQDVRASAGCRVVLLEAQSSAELRFGLDALHRKALTVALRPVCASG
jgi:chorismate mutase